MKITATYIIKCSDLIKNSDMTIRDLVDDFPFLAGEEQSYIKLHYTVPCGFFIETRNGVINNVADWEDSRILDILYNY